MNVAIGMADLDDLMNRIPVDSIAARLGAEPDAVRAAVGQAVPTLLAGLQAQTGDEQQAQKLAGALADHNDSLADGDITIDDVDTADGSKIVTKMFGDRSPELASALSDAVPAAGVDQGLIQKLLPMLAPIVLSYVAGKMMAASRGRARPPRTPPAASATSWAGCSAVGAETAAVSVTSSVVCWAAARTTVPSAASWADCSGAVAEAPRTPGVR